MNGMENDNEIWQTVEAWCDRCDFSNPSPFWIRPGDFCISLEIYRTNPEEVFKLYKLFIQKTSETRDMHFGIDKYKFVKNIPYENLYYECLPDEREDSNYWFSSGNLVINFKGKFMSTEKIIRLFALIKESVKESNALHFGVNSVEFSHIPEFCCQPPTNITEADHSVNCREVPPAYISSEDLIALYMGIYPVFC